jgi:DNA (cytosine-5)-methyltransferase 1
MPNAESGPSAVDLFSGCGGLTLGLKQAGFRVVAAVEVDSLAAETYRVNHPEVLLYEQDIRGVSPARLCTDLGIRKGDLDLLVGCPPCQGFSAIRTLNGSHTIQDPRNDLLFELLRFVKALEPKAVMLENVPALAADARFRAYCKHLADLGYRDHHCVLDASDYGVPQRRRRLVSVAARHALMEFRPPTVRGRTVRDAIGRLPSPGESDDPLHDMAENRTARVRRLIELIPRDGGSRADLPRRQWLRCHRKCDGFGDVYGRMAWDDVAPTITGGCINPSKGRFLHPEQDRAITLREAALLQSFPRDYLVSLREGRYRAASLIGNALPPTFVCAVSRALRRSLDRDALGE